MGETPCCTFAEEDTRLENRELRDKFRPLCDKQLPDEKPKLGMRKIDVFTPKDMFTPRQPSLTLCACGYLQALGRQSAWVGHISV